MFHIEDPDPAVTAFLNLVMFGRFGCDNCPLTEFLVGRKSHTRLEDLLEHVEAQRDAGGAKSGERRRWTQSTGCPSTRRPST